MNVRSITAALVSLSLVTFAAPAFADDAASPAECASGINHTTGLCSTLGVKTAAAGTNAAAQSIARSAVAPAAERPSHRVNAAAYRVPASHEHAGRPHR
jgi:hypothetical protein